MANNKTKADRIHDLIPKVFNTRINPNWSAIINALGESDQFLADLAKEVRNQFFIKTASRPYIDRLGANFKVSRPRLVGMDDASFRDYIPILAYQPKQVKLVMDKLLDVFFFKESTTSFIQSTLPENFNLIDSWTLDITVDSTYTETITFRSNDFTDINNATADEVVGAYNRQAKYTFAIVFDDRIKKQKFIRIFTKTTGSKGSLEIAGGLSNKTLQFSGYNSIAGSDSNTQWTITKVGDIMTFTYAGGGNPSIASLQIGDIAIVNIPNNEGSFIITNVDAGTDSFSYRNVFGTSGTHNHTGLDTFINFLTPEKTVIFANNNRAVTWEVTPGEIIVEMPASPPVVKRDLKGSAHINASIRSMVSKDSSTSMTLSDIGDWPNSGQFVLQERKAILSRISTPLIDEQVTSTFTSRFNKQNRYSYTGKSGNQITGISPDLPVTAQNFQRPIVSATRASAKTVTVTTSVSHGFNVGEIVKVQDTIAGIRVDVLTTDTADNVATKTANAIANINDFNTIANTDFVEVTNVKVGTTTDAIDVDAGVSILVTQQGTTLLPEITKITCLAGAIYDVVGDGLRWNLWSGGNSRSYYVWYNVTDGINTQSNPILDAPINGSWTISEVPSANSFTYISIGDDGTTFNGTARVERVAMATSGSLVYLTSSLLNTGIIGPYVWDLSAAYVLSSLTSTIQTTINAGQNVRTLPIASTNNIPNKEGYVIFDFGTSYEEGPVRYLYKPNSTSMQLDPAYIFQHNHTVNSSVTVIRKRGPIVMSGLGLEYAPYITDPSVARVILQDLLKNVKSVGIFLEFLVRYPDQLYAHLDVYSSNRDELWPITSENI